MIKRLYKVTLFSYQCIGMVLFLEEDHFVAEDFLSMLVLMKHERDSRYPNCDILCLGTYLKKTNYKDDHKKVSKRLLCNQDLSLNRD